MSQELSQLQQSVHADLDDLEHRVGELTGAFRTLARLHKVNYDRVVSLETRVLSRVNKLETSLYSKLERLEKLLTGDPQT